VPALGDDLLDPDVEGEDCSCELVKSLCLPLRCSIYSNHLLLDAHHSQQLVIYRWTDEAIVESAVEQNTSPDNRIGGLVMECLSRGDVLQLLVGDCLRSYRAALPCARFHIKFGRLERQTILRRWVEI